MPTLLAVVAVPAKVAVIVEVLASTVTFALVNIGKLPV